MEFAALFARPVSAPLLKSSLFLADYREIVSHLAEVNPDAADRFCGAVEETLQLLPRFPELGRLAGFPLAPNVRRWGISGFRNYVLFYQVRPEGLLIVRLLHGAQDLPPLVPRS
jgi:toxin ParE1/3/4